MNVNWEIWLDSPSGERVLLLDRIGGFSVSKVANDVGACSVMILAELIDENYLVEDAVLEFWRAAEGAITSLFEIYFLRSIEYQDVNGMDYVVLGGVSPLELLARRIVAYAAESAYSLKSADPADDIIRSVVSENLGVGATDADRSLGAYITGDANKSLGPDVTKAFAWRNVLLVCQEVAKESMQAGTEMYFGLVPYFTSGDTLRMWFEIWINQIGQDRTQDGGDPVFFGKEYGNLDDATLTYDYLDEVNYVYVGGQGEEAIREVVEVEDLVREGKSIWNRREGFVDGREQKTTAGLTSKGKSELDDKKPRLRFSGKLRDSDQYRFGVDWEFGDRVTCSYRGKQFDGMIRAVAIEVGGDGREQLTAAVEVEE